MSDPVVILSTDVPGISVSILGQEVNKTFQSMGVETELVMTPPKARNTWTGNSKLHQRRVVCLIDHNAGAALANPRFVRLRGLVSVFTVNWEEYTTADKMAYLGLFMKEKFGGVPVKHISHSHNTAAAVDKFVKETFKPSIAEDILKQCHTVPFGIHDIFDMPEKPAPVTKMLVPYNRVNQTQKNIRLHGKAMSTFMQLMKVNRGVDVTTDFFYANGFGPMDKTLEFNRECYNFIPQGPREEFPAKLREYGMFLCTSMFESFGLYYLEMLASGQVGVFLDKPWIRRLLPDYKFIVPEAELVNCMAYVHDNYEECSKYVREIVAPRIKKEYSLRRFCQETLNLLNSISNPPREV